jgi:hypothetical protein
VRGLHQVNYREIAMKRRPASLCLDVFELRVTHVDYEPVTENEKDERRIRFFTTGRVKVFEGGRWRSLTKEEARHFVEPIVKKYGLLWPLQCR